MPSLYYWYPQIISSSDIAVELTIRQIISRHKSRLNFFFHFNWKDNCSTVHTKIVYKVLVGQSVG